jgi:hypothetical protein
MSLSEQADRLGKRRARMFPILAIFFLTQQAAFFSSAHGDRMVDHVRTGAWVSLSLVILLLLVTKGFWFRSAKLRELLDDETTRANRADALSLGFAAAMFGAIAAFLINQFEPLHPDEVAHLVTTLGLATALIRFGMLERRAHAER